MGRVILDTSAWSLAVRRRPGAALPANEQRVRIEVASLAERREAVLLGPVRQELLTGLREMDRFERLRRALGAVPDEPIMTTDHERAAEMSNACRAAGVQGSPTDFLVCAVAERLDVPILASDADFPRYAQHLPIRLHGLA